MIITLSPGFMCDKPRLDDWVHQCATSLGLHFRIKWNNKRSIRGRLVTAPLSFTNATDAEHDSFIAKIFELDPDAYVRTALAVYNTKAEFDARLPLEETR